LTQHHKIGFEPHFNGVFLSVFERYITSLLFLCELHPYRLNHKGLISVICSTITTTKMKNSPKLAILQSLDIMDQMQMENVLIYIRELLQKHGDVTNQSFKKEAMKEIRQALRQYKRKENLQMMA